MATILSNTGCSWIVSILTGSASSNQFLGWGTGSGISNKADTTLFSEASTGISMGGESRVQMTRSTCGNDVVQWTATLTANSTKSITNLGNFTGSGSAAPGYMIVKGDLGSGSATLSANDMMQTTIYLQIT